MGFSNIKLSPSKSLLKDVDGTIFNRVRSTNKRKSRRNRECYLCLKRIEKNDYYINHQFNYDKRIITISFHINCFNSEI